MLVEVQGSWFSIQLSAVMIWLLNLVTKFGISHLLTISVEHMN